ncbi:MAG: hypothetical protein U0169_19325 [Polyangiaceae bacterium]
MRSPRSTRSVPSISAPASFVPWLSLGLVVAACGGEAPAAKAPEAPAAKPVAPVKERVDVSQVPVPKNLVVDGRLANPARVLGIVNGWVAKEMPSFPKAVTGENLAQLVLDENVGDVFDLREPVDFALAVDMGGRESFAVSFPLRSLDTIRPALEAHFTLAALDNGVLRLDPPRRAPVEKKPKKRVDVDDEEDADDEPMEGLHGKACVVAPAAGAAAFRLVCSRRDRMLTDLAPYLTRTLTRADTTNDFKIEVHPEPIREAARRFGPMAIAGASSFARQSGAGPATDDFVRSFVGEIQDLASDLEQVTVETSIAETGLEPTLKVGFRGNAALTTRIALFDQGKDDVPPPSFWKLPADAGQAVSSRVVDPAMLEKPKTLLFAMLAELASTFKLPASEVKVALDLAGKIVVPRSYVSASGVDMTAVEKAFAAVKAAADKDAAKAKKALSEESFGYKVGVVEQPMATTAATFKDLATWVSRPAVQKFMKDLSKEAAGLSFTFKSAPTSKALGLPKDTVHYVASIKVPEDDHESVPPSPTVMTRNPKTAKTAAKKPAPLRESVIHLFLAPDATRTFYGVAMREDIAAKSLRTLFGTEPAAKTLDTRTDLESLKSARMHSGGFWTLETFATSLVSTLTGAGSTKDARMFGKMMAERPALELPLNFATHVNVADARNTQGSYSATMTIPQPVIALGIRTALRGGLRF